MPKFSVTFQRDVIQRDEFVRVIEASDEAAARIIAEREAAAADESCPDDACCTGSDECESWGVLDIDPADDDAEADISEDEI